MSHEFSKRSKIALESCHKDLQLIMREALKYSSIDFGISEGYRSAMRQAELFRIGRSKIDGINNKSKHNYSPSLAADVFAWVKRDGKIECYNIQDLSFIAGVIISTAKRLKEEGRISGEIRWGGNWDQDGEILTDQKFDDLPHFELKFK